MKRKIILSFIVTAIILSSCSLGENKVSSSKNSNVASGTVISDNKETEGNTQSNSLEKEIDEKITEDTIITELKKGKFEYKETVKKVIAIKEYIFHHLKSIMKCWMAACVIRLII